MASEQLQDPIDAFVNECKGKMAKTIDTELRNIGETFKYYLWEQLSLERTHRVELERQLKELEIKNNKMCVFVQNESTALNERHRELVKWERELAKWERNLEEREEAVIFYEEFLKSANLNPASYHDRQHKQQKHHTDHTPISAQELQEDSITMALDSNHHQQPTHYRRRSSSVDRNDSKPCSNKVYGEIRPGSITHEDIQRQFTDYFTKYRRKYGSMLVVYKEQKGTIPCQILQIAYDESMNKVLSIIKETLQKPQTKDAKKAKRMLVKSGHSTSITAEDRELHLLFARPIKQMCIESGNPRNWEETKYAFTLLLNSSDINTEAIMSGIKEKILTKHIKGVQSDEVIGMLDNAIELAWNMVTLVPPAIVYQPLDYVEEWQERRYTCWKEDGGSSGLIHFRPVLFFSALGHVGCKGEIGNIPPQSTNDKHCPLSIVSNPSKASSSKVLTPIVVKKSLVPPRSSVLSKDKVSQKNPCINPELANSFNLQRSCQRCGGSCDLSWGMCRDCMTS